MSEPAPTYDDTSPPPIERILEALLFVGGAPLSVTRACEAVRGLTAEGCALSIAGLNRAYRRQGRPYRIQLRQDGYEMALHPSFRQVRDRLFGGPREARLSPPALDTLALIAYKQPVTRGDLDSLRGADSLGPLRQLLRLGLVAVQRDAAQAEPVYGTTGRFLQLFGLRNLDDLPRTTELQKL